MYVCVQCIECGMPWHTSVNVRNIRNQNGIFPVVQYHIFYHFTLYKWVCVAFFVSPSFVCCMCHSWDRFLPYVCVCTYIFESPIFSLLLFLVHAFWLLLWEMKTRFVDHTCRGPLSLGICDIQSWSTQYSSRKATWRKFSFIPLFFPSEKVIL